MSGKKKGDLWGRLFSFAVFNVTGSLSFGGRLFFPRGKGKLFAAFLGQGVAILVLNQTIEVQVGDALSNAGFADVEICSPQCASRSCAQEQQGGCDTGSRFCAGE